MAYVPVPKDLTQVKSRFLFGLTRRQVLFFGLGALTGVPFFLLIRHSVNTSLATMLMMLLMLPFFLLALYEKNGQPLEAVRDHRAECGIVSLHVATGETAGQTATGRGAAW